MMQGDIVHIKYPVLFTVKLLHHYFLDTKTQSFDDLPTEEDRVRMLAGYDARGIFDITPSPATEKILAGNGLLFKRHNLGFTVLANRLPSTGGGFEPPSKLPEGTLLRFLLRVNDPSFFQYSSPFLRKPPSRIEKAAAIGDPDKVFFHAYRLSNEVGNDVDSIVPLLSKPPVDAGSLPAPYPVESIMRVGGVVKQAKLRSPDLDNDNWQTIFNGRFVTDADLTELEVSAELPPDVFGIIDISASSAISKEAYRLYKPDNSLNAPKFEVRIKNRSTWWRYLELSGGGIQATVKDYKPLTAKGRFPFTNPDLPNPDAGTPTSWETSGGQAVRLFSDVYL